MLDLRLPAGLFFTLTGLVLVALGLTSHPRAAMTDVNVDLWAGGAMLAFGLILLALAARGKRHA